jgi:hypothetical protein
MSNSWACTRPTIHRINKNRRVRRINLPIDSKKLKIPHKNTKIETFCPTGFAEKRTLFVNFSRNVKKAVPSARKAASQKTFSKIFLFLSHKKTKLLSVKI